MTDTQAKATIKPKEAEKAQDKRKRPAPAPEYGGALVGESSPFIGLLGDSVMGLPVERHAALLRDPRFSRPANAVQRSRVIGELQRWYGNRHVSGILNRDSTEEHQAKSITGEQSSDVVNRLSEQVISRQATAQSGRGVATSFHIKKSWKAPPLRTKGINLRYITIGKKVSGEISVDGALTHLPGGTATTTGKLVVAPWERTATLELEKELRGGWKWKGGGEINEDGGKLSSGLELEILKEGGFTFTLDSDAILFQKEGNQITYLAAEIGLKGARNIEIQRKDWKFSGNVEIKLSTTVEPNWPVIGRDFAKYGLRFAGQAAQTVTRLWPLIAASTPYVAAAAVAAAYIAFIAFGIYMCIEARKAGSRKGLYLHFAQGYARSLSKAIYAGKHGEENIIPDTERSLLGVDPVGLFEEGVALDDKGGGNVWVSRDAQKMCERAGRAAGIQNVQDFVNRNGRDAWNRWCEGRTDSYQVYNNKLCGQVYSGENVGISIE